MLLKHRAKRAINLKQYSYPNTPERISPLDLAPPNDRQYILRMLVKKPFGDFKIPSQLRWIEPAIKISAENQARMNIHQPFCHVTVRHGEVTSEKDDQWHVDGFSMNITHLPEQNYIWINKYPTEYMVRGFNIPDGFDPYVHNIHMLFQDLIEDADEVRTLDEKTLYCLDPYILHRRPAVPKEIKRTFLRISYCPIEIRDINNTQNPLIKRNYKRDGVNDFRNQLERFPV